MRVIKPPPPKEEIEYTCPHCGAILAYTEDDIMYEMGFGGDIKYIICAYCNTQIKLKYIPYPNSPFKSLQEQ